MLFLIALTSSTGAQNETIARGEKLAHQKCDVCHTLRNDKQQPVLGRFAGGKVLAGVASANLTLDPSGISYYDEAMFVQALRTGQVGARKLKPLMVPVVKDLSDDDLTAIFAYLRTVPPVKHRVDNTEAPTPCRLCRQKHGAGDTNE